MANGLGVRHDRRHVHSWLRELGMETCRSVSTPLSATVEKEGDRSDRPEVSAELATKHRAAVARVVYLATGSAGYEWRQLSSPKHSYSEWVTTNASNVLHDIFMVILTTCHGTQVRKKRTQLLCPQRITSIEVRRDFAVGRSSRRRVESGPTTHYSRAVCWHARNLGNSFT